jgi:hypothetical protein
MMNYADFSLVTAGGCVKINQQFGMVVTVTLKSLQIET